MVLLPFIYFTLLTLYWWKKHKGIDVCVYMSGLYAVSTFCALLIVGSWWFGKKTIKAHIPYLPEITINRD